ADGHAELVAARGATFAAQLFQPPRRCGFGTLAAHRSTATDTPTIPANSACNRGMSSGMVSANTPNASPTLTCRPIEKIPNCGANLARAPWVPKVGSYNAAIENPAWKSSRFAPNAMAVYASVAAKPDRAPTTASPARVVQLTSTPAGRPSLASTGTRIRAVNSPSPIRA